MRAMMVPVLVMAAMLAVAGLSGAADIAAGEAGDSGTQVLKWKDGKKAVFLLEFDDSCQSHVKNAIPELQKRGMVGTFYIIPGSAWFKTDQAAWEKDVPAKGMEYGNHTWSHAGAQSAAQLDEELRKANDELDKCYPDRPRPRLISFARPGVPKEKWRVTDAEVAAALAKYHLIQRAPFYGPPRQAGTVPAMQKLVDDTIAGGEMGRLNFHGVGGDWLSVPMDYFIALLDKLDSRRDDLWITDPISHLKYLTERTTAKVTTVRSDPAQIRLRLSSQADAALYDLPLTLVTKVPSTWKHCQIVQGAAKTTAAVVNGEVRYDALPGDKEIVIEPVAAGQ